MLQPSPLTPFDRRREEVLSSVADPVIRAAIVRTLDRVDPAAIGALQEKHREQCAASKPSGPFKYLDLPYWAWAHAPKARTLGLLEPGLPRSVFDIGSGGGSFLAICAAHGHEVLGLDRPEPRHYGELLSVWGVRRVEEEVRLGRPLSVGRFDLITAMATLLDADPRGGFWGLGEWQAFLNHLSAEHLKLPGEIYLEINQRMVDGERRFCAEIVTACAALGADVAPHRGMIHLRLSEPLAFDAPPFLEPALSNE